MDDMIRQAKVGNFIGRKEEAWHSPLYPVCIVLQCKGNLVQGPLQLLSSGLDLHPILMLCLCSY